MARTTMTKGPKMNSAAVDALLAGVREVLKGIDQDETASSEGWWETSVGVAFGAERLAALEALLRDRLGAVASRHV